LGLRHEIPCMGYVRFTLYFMISLLILFPRYIQETIAMDNEKYPHTEQRLGLNTIPSPGIMNGPPSLSMMPSNQPEQSFKRALQRPTAMTSGMLATLM